MSAHRLKAAVVAFTLCISLLLSLGLRAEAPTSDAWQREHIPIYDIAISRSAQAAIWAHCVEEGLSYELILSIFLIDASADFGIESIPQKIRSLVVIRDHWLSEGHSNEITYFLLLISHRRGIEGCYLLMDTYEPIEEDLYVQQVTQMKYLLEGYGNPLDSLDLQIKTRVY